MLFVILFVAFNALFITIICLRFKNGNLIKFICSKRIFGFQKECISEKRKAKTTKLMEI